jgi:adenosylcobinamide-GDP ribazoletransferase
VVRKPGGRLISAQAAHGDSGPPREGIEVATRAAWWREALAPPVLACQFLTAVPLPLSVPAGPRQLGRALALFPLVGAVLGLVLGGLDALLRVVFPLAVASALVLVAGTLLTGGLHLDGLMDTCDGLFGGGTAERRLEIMRDSRVGSFGVLGGALQLLVKLAALGALGVGVVGAPVPFGAPLGVRGGALVTSLVAGRLAMVAAMWLFPYARPTGLGAAFKAGLRFPAVAIATGFALTVAWVALGWVGSVLVLVATALALLAARWIAGLLGGGLTGDAYGATNELAETAVLLGLLAWLGRGGSGG